MKRGILMKKKMLSVVMAALILGGSTVPALTSKVSDATLTNACVQAETGSLAEQLDEPKSVDALIQDFSTEMFKELYKDGENSLVSPLSLYTALSMLENGVDGKSRDELLNLLVGSSDGDSIQEEDINNFFKEYMEMLASENSTPGDYEKQKAELNIANSIWNNTCNDFIVYNDDYIQKANNFYKADLYDEDFTDPETVNKLNSWIEDKTKGRIKDMFNELSEDSQNILINALSFDAEWSEPFVGVDGCDYYSRDGYSGCVRDDVFHNSDGTAVKSEFLCSTEYKGTYIKDDYAVGMKKAYVGNFYMAALVPNEGITLEEYINEYLTSDSLRSTLKNEVKDGIVKLSMPKFSFDCAYSGGDTIGAMKNLGVSQIFEKTRDYSRMYDFTNPIMQDENMKFWVSDIMHNTNISVDGAGTKAAAATAIMIDCDTAIIDDLPTYQVNLDRPFLFVICDSRNDMPVFMGALNNLEGDIVETPDPEPAPSPDPAPAPDPEPEPVPMPEPIVMGDVDGSGRLTLKDASMILRSLAGLESLDKEQKIIADINGNGKVDTQDSLIIQRMIAGLQ